MILIFDLDDTLYSEKLYAISGFKAVANYVSSTYGLPVSETLEDLKTSLDQGDRAQAFQRLIVSRNLPRESIKKFISVYRMHQPDIQLYSAAEIVLSRYEDIHKYLVTDGNKIVQRNKINALNLDKVLKRSLITHSFGLSASKPSTYCFQKIKDLEKADWEDLVYVGDDPRKDFVNLKPLGVTTVRVLTGRHAETEVSEEFEAKFRILSLEGLERVLELRNAE
jgi:putative hydrolase of the HAD superfamily